MKLKGILYKKLKKKMDERKKEALRKQSRETQPKRTEQAKVAVAEKPAAAKPAVVKPAALPEIRGSARYWGGHFLYPIKTIELGELAVSRHAITFTKYGFLRRPEWNIEIPLNKIEWKRVAHTTEEDGLYNTTCFTIPFRDDKGVVHQPKFSVENSRARESFSKFLYKKMTK